MIYRARLAQLLDLIAEFGASALVIDHHRSVQ